MSGMGERGVFGGWRGWASLAAICAALGFVAPAPAQTGPASAGNTVGAATPAAPAPAAEGSVQQAGCSSCAGGALGGMIGLPAGGVDGGGCDGCCGKCYPGRKPCDCDCDCDWFGGRFLCGVYKCICCPDPCYDPRWNALADSAFFADAPRPQTQMRLRGDFGSQFQFPDKAEYFWARADGMGKGPMPPAGVRGERNLDYNEGSLYMEGARGAIGVFVELPYLDIEPETYRPASGLADMNVGTKTLLLDCELLQFSFQFRTFIPTGNFTRGLGTGHVSLEPSFLLAVKLTPDSYLQAQFSYLFPVGGDANYEGPIFHYHLSYNKLLCNCGHDVQLIGTLELSGYEIEGGAYTYPDTGNPASASDIGDILEAGPGLRLNICDRVDFGVGSLFALTHDRMTEALVRAEFRWRF